MIAIPDVDHDGVNDIVVCDAWGSADGGPIGFVVSAAKQEVVHRIDSLWEDRHLQLRILPAERDADGLVRRLFVSVPRYESKDRQGVLGLWSTADHRYERVIHGSSAGFENFGCSAVLLGPSQWIIGAPWAGGDGDRSGAVRWLGENGESIRELVGSKEFPGLGWCMATIGNLDADKHADLIVSNGFPGTPSKMRRVQCLSGKDGAVLHTLKCPDDSPSFGYALQVLRDIDGDGVEDFAVAAPDLEAEASRAHVFLYSGRGGGLLRSIEGGPGSALGFAMSALYEGDAVRIVLGDPANSTVSVVNARTGVIEDTYRSDTFSGFGVSLDASADVDADGRADIIVGACNPNSGEWPGSVQVITRKSNKKLPPITRESLERK